MMASATNAPPTMTDQSVMVGRIAAASGGDRRADDGAMTCRASVRRSNARDGLWRWRRRMVALSLHVACRGDGARSRGDCRGLGS